MALKPSSADLIRNSAQKMKATVTSSKAPSALSLIEEQDFKIAELENKNLKNLELNQIIKLREKYAGYILKFLIVWSAITIFMVITSACELTGFKLPESTQNILIGTCFGNVLALAGVVAKGLFRSVEI